MLGQNYMQFKTPSQILEFEMESNFDKLNLFQHLGITRGNGLRSMVARIKSIALEVDSQPREVKS
ncbi:MAG: SufE family protein [Gammaproteobacteria bacterium]|nr:SufE family protein [Gammaproteobacteria bacterium]